MNALRNFWSRPVLSLLGQSGQNAIINLTKPPIENALPLAANSTDVTSNNKQQIKAQTSSCLCIPNDFKFVGKKFEKYYGAGQISPTTLKQFRRLERKVEIVYRCTACNTRNTKLISELAYTNGIVILQCDGCGIDHLIKDNLGWFSNSKGKTFDQVLAENCDDIKVKVIKVNQYGELI